MVANPEDLVQASPRLGLTMSPSLTPTRPRRESSRALPDPCEYPTISVERAAAVLGVSRGTAYDAVRRGVIPSIRIGRRVLVPTVRLAALLAGK